MLNKQLIINMVSAIIAFVVNMGINFVLSPYIIENVGVEAYGFVSLGNNFISYASLLTIALNSMAGRFITINLHREDYEKANKYFNSVLIGNIITSTILIVISGVMIVNLEKLVDIPSEIMLDVKMLFVFLFINFILSIISSTFGVATFSTNKLYLSSLRGIESNIFRGILLFILFLFLEPRISYMGIVAFIVTAYLLGFNIYYTKKLLPEIKISSKYFDFNAIMEIISSGIWNVFTKLSAILSAGLDLLIANLFISATAMGTLSLSKTVTTLILSVFGMLAGVFAPDLTVSYAKEKYEDMRQQLVFSISILGVISSIPMAVLFVYGDIFYALWVPTENAKLLQFLSIAGSFGMIFSLPLESVWNVFTISNKIKQSSIFLFFNSLITILIVFITIRWTNSDINRLFIIAGVSTVISIIRAWTFLPIYGAKCMKLKWNTFYPVIIKNTFGVILVTLSGAIIRYIIKPYSWKTLIITILLTSVVGLIINTFLIIEKKQRKQIIQAIKDINKKSAI